MEEITFKAVATLCDRYGIDILEISTADDGLDVTLKGAGDMTPEDTAHAFFDRTAAYGYARHMDMDLMLSGWRATCHAGHVHIYALPDREPIDRANVDIPRAAREELRAWHDLAEACIECGLDDAEDRENLLDNMHDIMATYGWMVAGDVE